MSHLRLLALIVLLAAAEAASAQQGAVPDRPSPAAAEQRQQRPALTFFQIVFSGGPLGVLNMLVLIGLSIAALALALDNIRVVRKSHVIPPALADEVEDLVGAGDLGRAAAACQAQPSFLASVLAHGIAEAGSGWQDVEKALEDATAEQAARLFRRIEYLNVIGNIAPMVGLLGTVTGMLLAFKQVADTEGNAGAAQLAGGIYQALVTTVVGLMIAIPSLGAFALLRSRVDQLVAEAAYAAMHALSPLKQRSPVETAAVTPPPPLLAAKSVPGAGT